MNTIARQFALVLSAALALGMGATSALAQDNGYVQAPTSGVTVKNPFGLCWRTGYWTPAMATMECDPDLVPKKAEPAPAPVVDGTPRLACAPAAVVAPVPPLSTATVTVTFAPETAAAVTL